MTISSSLSADGKILNIFVDDRLDATSLDNFRHSYENYDSKTIDVYSVDLRYTEHLDSSALGMLLVLRDFAENDAARVRVINCSPEVKNIFIIANFNQLFDIE